VSDFVIRDARVEPAFVTLPKSGQKCPLTGLPRKFLETLILPTIENRRRPVVKSKEILDSNGDVQRRLICYSSLIEYLNTLPEPL
jgi:hypothetical protein